MSCRSRLILSFAIAVLLPGISVAGQEAEHEARFRAADTDNSRSLSLEEVSAGMPKVILKHFDAIDLDSDGQITPEELKQMAARQAELREQRRAERLRRMQRNK